MKTLSILGSTGSIGQSTLRVVSDMPDHFQVKALAAKSNIDLLERQIHTFSPELVAVFDEDKALELSKRQSKARVVSGIEGLLEVAAFDKSDCVVIALSGTIGILPTLEAIKNSKTVALANKEVLVSAGELVMKLVKETGVNFLPIDSEQNALHQLLEGRKKEDVSKLILTASGGPFHTFPKEKLSKVSLQQALNHPSWEMGYKNTVDSSTLMNKGLEVIEARWFFDFDPQTIDVVIHPQSLVHSFIELVDGSLLAQISVTDMALPIQYALTYPHREKRIVEPFDFKKLSRFDFYEPDYDKFLCLKLALEAMEEGDSTACFLNAANEVLVDRFVSKEIAWIDIGRKLETLLEKHKKTSLENIEVVISIDKEARELAKSI